MSFSTDINAILTADPSLNSYADGGIHYENLIDNWLAETNDEIWIVYSFNKSEQGNCLTYKNLYMTYSLNISVIQRDSNAKIDIVTDRLIKYLNNYDTGSFIDIGFMRDQGFFDQQKNIYVNGLEFQCIYIES